MKNTEIDLSAGDVVLLDFPGVKQTKRRLAVILSSPLYHDHRPDVIAGLITSQVDAASSPTDYVLRDWAKFDSDNARPFAHSSLHSRARPLNERLENFRIVTGNQLLKEFSECLVSGSGIKQRRRSSCGCGRTTSSRR